MKRLPWLFGVFFLTIIGLFWYRSFPGFLSESRLPEDLRVEYFFTAETVYQDVLIKGSGSGSLLYTYFPREKIGNMSPEMMVRQTPAWTANDLLTKEAPLDEKQLHDLTGLILRAGFMDLSDVYGGAGEGQRYYPCVISVKVGKRERKVLYQDFPEASPRPAAFSAVEKEVLDFIRAKFGDM